MRAEGEFRHENDELPMPHICAPPQRKPGRRKLAEFHHSSPCGDREGMPGIGFLKPTIYVKSQRKQES